jgi:hypothetical protein
VGIKEDKMADTVKSLGLSVSAQGTLIRVLRTIVAQLPAMIAWLQGSGVNPKLVALGVLLNGVFKFLRDMFPGWIIWVPL